VDAVVWLVVGLGNPGPKYANNRHNIGFLVVDELVRRHRIDAPRSKFGGEYTTGAIGGTKVHLLKPMEYMNLSGQAVTRACHYLKVEPASIVVVHDEIDFALGRVEVKDGGGHGGHNGLRSIIQQLGNNTFARVRCGVGRPLREDGAPVAKDRVSGYVLSDFPRADARAAEDLIADAADAIEAVVRLGARGAMNECNGKARPAGR
jgi:PTH1 family peptidyl-tRNA hydrolase